MSAEAATRDTCPDCGVETGEAHREECDVAVCVHTGMQRLLCGVVPVFVGGELVSMDDRDAHPGEDCGADIWSGEWPGNADCRRLGWYSYFVPYGDPSWVPCSPDHPGATEDLNRLNPIDARWDKAARRWEAKEAVNVR